MPQLTDKKYFYEPAHIASYGYTGPHELQENYDGWPTNLREVKATIWPKDFCERVLKEAHNIFWRPVGELLGDVFYHDNLLGDQVG